MILIMLGIIFYLIQVGVIITFLIQGDILTKREFKISLIPYPYWICVGIIWLIKFAISQYKELK